MAKCGEYEIDKAIGWGRHATFFSARANGDTGESLVVIRRARLAEHVSAQLLFRAAAEQAAAVESGCRRLAPVLGFELDSNGFAFYATVRYKWSLSEFVESGCKVDGAMLREIVIGTLEALGELAEKFLRSHGNLTLGNLLLDKDHRVFLTDLAPSGRDLAPADDLFALGTLIYQLVRCTLHVGTLNPPLEYSPEWSETLGDEAAGWLEFTNRLLSRSRFQGPEAFESAAADLKNLAVLAPAVGGGKGPGAGRDSNQPIESSPKKYPLQQIAALLALLVVIVVAFGTGGPDNPTPTPTPPPLLPGLEALKRNLDQPLPSEITDATEINTVRVLTELIRPELNKKSSDPKKGLKTQQDNWNLPRKLAPTVMDWRTRGGHWVALANELDKAGKINYDIADPPAPYLDQYVAAIRAWRNSKLLNERWILLSTCCAELASATNDAIPNFEPQVEREVLTRPSLADSAENAAAALEALETLKTSLTKKWENVQQDRFRQSARDISNRHAGDSLASLLQDFENEVANCQKPEIKVINGWDKKLSYAERRIGVLTTDQRGQWKKALEAAKKDFDKLSVAKAIAVASEAAQITTEIEGLAEKLGKMRTQAEEIVYQAYENASKGHEAYSKFLKGWQQRCQAGDITRPTAESLVKDYVDVTSTLGEYQKIIRREDVIKNLRTALSTPETIKLLFEDKDKKNPGWTIIKSTAISATALFNGKVEIPFILLDNAGAGIQKRFAMSAYETPLALVKETSAKEPVGTGPKIRTEEFKSLPREDDWLWEDAKSLETPLGHKIPYFANSKIKAGDVANSDCPATWVAFKSAKQIAQSLGGRLPTVDEWRAASNSPMRDRTTERLRGHTWKQQYDYYGKFVSMTGERQDRCIPNLGSFSAGDNDPLSLPSDDGFLWLRSVKPDKSAEKFYHLVGNAAEWVTGKTESDAIIIGGSVVSPPGKALVEVPQANQSLAFFDVTFRLVVPVAPGGVGNALEEFKKAAGKIVLPSAPVPPGS